MGLRAEAPLRGPADNAALKVSAVSAGLLVFGVITITGGTMRKTAVDEIGLVEAALLLHVGYQVAHRLALQGILDARRTNGRWSVSRASVEQVLKDRGATPEPEPAA